MRKVLEIDNNEIRKKKETIKMAKVKTFKTIFPAVSVPLNDDYSINEPEFRAYLRWIKTFYGKGMDGLVCNGHTGEITGLTRAERKRVVEICAEECGDVMTIISGVNCENTAESIEMAKEAKEAGADGILLMPPHMWLRFGMNPDAPFEYVKDVAEGADIDIIIHLVPGNKQSFLPGRDTDQNVQRDRSCKMYQDGNTSYIYLRA